MSVGGDEEKQRAITDLLALAARTSQELATGIPSREAVAEAGAPAWWHGEEEASEEALGMVRSGAR